jgi:hypothetical protein
MNVKQTLSRLIPCWWIGLFYPIKCAAGDIVCCGPRRLSCALIALRLRVGMTPLEILCDVIADNLLLPVMILTGRYDGRVGSLFSWLIRGHVRCMRSLDSAGYWCLPPSIWARLAYWKAWRSWPPTYSILRLSTE